MATWTDSRVQEDIASEVDILTEVLNKLTYLPKDQALRVMRYCADYLANKDYSIMGGVQRAEVKE